MMKLCVAVALLLCLLFISVGRTTSSEVKIAYLITAIKNGAVSVRVSNELGAGEPKAAKSAVVVNTLTCAVIGLMFAVFVIATRSHSHFPKMFTDKPRVIRDTSKLSYLLAAIIFLNSIQPVLHGVAVGAGWQFQVALVNIVTYYVFGLPFAALLGYKFSPHVWGIWSAMFGDGMVLQTIILSFIAIKTNWRKEAVQAEERVRAWEVKWFLNRDCDFLPIQSNSIATGF